MKELFLKTTLMIFLVAAFSFAQAQSKERDKPNDKPSSGRSNDKSSSCKETRTRDYDCPRGSTNGRQTDYEKCTFRERQVRTCKKD